jgi:hypothetical protein
MTRGEELKIKIHYDLFGFDVYKKIGTYISTSPSSQKLLVYFPNSGEWGEFLIDQVERIDPDVVSAKNSEFIKCVQKL